MLSQEEGLMLVGVWRRTQMGLFILLKKDDGLAKIMR